MRISIVTPVFNGARDIGKTLASLGGSPVDLEHIVMDGGSTDETCAIVSEHAARHPCRLVSQPDEGIYDAIAQGFSLATGDVFAWLNAGDFYLPWTLPAVEKIFEEHPEVDWITGIPSLFHASRSTLEVSLYAPVYSRLLVRRGWHNGAHLDFIQQESTFWRRSLWERSGASALLKGQGRGRGYAMDFHLWRRFAEHARLYTVASVLAGFAITPGQISERHRVRYFAECGVSSPPARSNRWLMILFRVYSTLRARECLRV